MEKGNSGKKPALKVIQGGNQPAPQAHDTNMCKVRGCKKGLSKFGFCAEHFEHFKFGMITKHGAPALDHEKKQDQWVAQKAIVRKKVA